MLNYKDILNLQNKYEVSASKRFGQNFLVNHEVIGKIIEESKIHGKDVIEIGPGLGSMTIPMLEVAASVISYEIDFDMIKVLKGEMKQDNFKLVEGDFLKAELDWEGKKEMVANIPYNITSDILFTLFKNSNKFNSATLMMQKEVAQRIMAPVGSKTYGKLTLTTSLFASVSKVVLVKPTSFTPSPKVDSMVVKLDFIDGANYEKNIELMQFIKDIFTFRRKTLYNNLKTVLEPEDALKLIEELKFKSSIRPQELTLEEVKILFEAHKKYLK